MELLANDYKDIAPLMAEQSDIEHITALKEYKDALSSAGMAPDLDL